MSFGAHIAEYLRLAVLEVLVEQSDYSMRDDMMADAVTGRGFTAGIDKIRTTFAWLAEQGAVEVIKVQDGHIATITDRGIEHVDKRCVIPGIRRPKPARSI